MKVTQTDIPGVVIIDPDVHGDARGFFLETFQIRRYREEAGIQEGFVQDNQSRSRHGVLRGLHFQRTYPQGKLVHVTQGEVFDVAVDIRPESPAFGRWAGVRLSEENHRQFYVPPGCAHAFVVLSETADFQYKCTDFYHPEDEGSLIWNDPDVGIEWPIDNPQLSDKDAHAPTLRELFPDKFKD
ncbi:MAG: dTDP-4-dehydrorhamnose 3,5-epimerase [Pseudomonadota bacterium]